MRGLIAAAIVAGMLSGGVSSTWGGDSVSEQAQQLARKGRTDEAIELLLGELRKDLPAGERLGIHGMLGDLYAMKRDVDKAVAEYDAVIALAPGSGFPYFKKGEALKSRVTLASQEAAIAAFRESQRLGFSRPEVFSNIGFCKKCMADFGLVPEAMRADCLRAAEESFQQALKMDPKCYHALYHLTDLKFNTGRFGEAAAGYRSLLEMRPDDPLILVRLGHAIHSCGDAAGALPPLQQALVLIAHHKMLLGSAKNPAMEEAEVDCYLYRAEALLALSQEAAAAKDYRAVLDRTDPQKQKNLSAKMAACRQRASEMLQSKLAKLATATAGNEKIKPAAPPSADPAARWKKLLGATLDDALRTDYFLHFRFRETGREKNADGLPLVVFEQAPGAVFRDFVKTKVALDQRGKLAAVELRVSRAFLDVKPTTMFARDVVKSLLGQAVPSADSAAVAGLIKEIYPTTPGVKTKEGMTISVLPKETPSPANPSPACQVVIGKKESAEMTLSGCVIRLENTKSDPIDPALVIVVAVRK